MTNGNAKSRRQLVMLGTAFDTKGGISSVVNVYRQHGLFERWPILYLPTHCDGSFLRKIFRVIRSLIVYMWLLAVGQVAIVHAHTASGSSFWRKSIFILLAYAARRPVIFHLHGGNFDAFYARMGQWRQRLIRFVLDRASCIIVLSTQWESWIHSASHNQRVVCIHNPVTVRPLTEAPRNGYRLLFLGRMCRDKGTYDLLEVIANLGQRFPEAELFCAGDGEAQEVAARAQALGIWGRVKILDWVTGDAKNQLIETAGILVLPSYFEGLPMSVLEAMAAGVPVVTTTVGGIPDAVDDGVDGCLVEPGDKTMLERTLARLLEDHELQKRIGNAARQKIIERFSSNIVISKLEGIYTELNVAPATLLSAYDG